MVCNGKIEPEKLPPTDGAAICHGLRVHYQVIEWKMLDSTLTLDPRKWGWKKDEDHLVPIPTTNEIAPENLLIVIKCNCKSKNNTCGTNLCTCRKHGIRCMLSCGGCHGEDCINKMVSISPN